MAEDFIPLDKLEAEFIPLDELEPEQPKAPKEKESRKLLAGITSYGRGASLGFANEVSAYIMSLMDSGMSYDKAKEFVDRQYKSLDEQHPVISGVGKVAGAVLNPVNKFLPGGQLVKGVTEGAIMGAGESEEDRLSGALWGGSFGLGGALAAKPVQFLATRAAVKSIAASEKVIKKMTANIPGGKKVMGEFLLKNALVAPVRGAKQVIKKARALKGPVETQLDDYVKLASKHSDDLDMTKIYNEIEETVISPLREGATETHRLAAKKLEKFYPGIFDNPKQSLYKANEFRKGVDEAMGGVYKRLKEAKVSGVTGEVDDRALAQAREKITSIIDRNIDEGMEAAVLNGKINPTAHRSFKDVKGQYQLIREAEGAALNKFYSGKDTVNIRTSDSFLMMLNKYGALYSGARAAGEVVTKRGASAVASAANKAGKVLPRAGLVGPTAQNIADGGESDLPKDDGFIPLEDLQ